MLELAVALAVALGGREREPLADVGDLFGPAPVGFRGTLASTESHDDPLHLLELLLGVFAAAGGAQRAFRATAQCVAKIANLLVRIGRGFEQDIAAGVVIDAAQRAVDGLNAL